MRNKENSHEGQIIDSYNKMINNIDNSLKSFQKSAPPLRKGLWCLFMGNVYFVDLALLTAGNLARNMFFLLKAVGMSLLDKEKRLTVGDAFDNIKSVEEYNPNNVRALGLMTIVITSFLLRGFFSH